MSNRELAVVRLTAALLFVTLAVLAGCAGDDDSDAVADPAADATATATAGESDGDLCAAVTQEQLDGLVPGLEPEESSSGGIVCEWTADASEGSWLALLQQYEGEEYYGGDLVDDATPIDLCDRADLFGDTIQFQSDDTVVQVSFTQIGVPETERIGDEEASQRLEAFAREISQGVC